MTEQPEKTPARRVGYSTWNLVAVAVFAALALGDAVPALVGRPRHPLPWIFVGIVAGALVWGVRARHRRPSWLLPRLYLIVAVPAWLTITVTDDMTSFWLNAIWLLIVPAVLSDGWVDRWLGAPAPGLEDTTDIRQDVPAGASRT